MPVTARLSKAFYDRFGEQVTNELVEWFNQVDLTYRTDLQTLNDTNFARFEALLDSRFARADLQLERQVDQRSGESDRAIAQQFSQAAHRNDLRFSAMERDIAWIREDLRGIRDAQSEQLGYTVVLWMTTMVGLILVLATIIRQG